jgi:hypothetical protein
MHANGQEEDQPCRGELSQRAGGWFQWKVRPFHARSKAVSANLADL